jgi:hypothetical protein
MGESNVNSKIKKFKEGRRSEEVIKDMNFVQITLENMKVAVPNAAQQVGGMSYAQLAVVKELNM